MEHVDAAHAAMLARACLAEARVDAAANELRAALIEREALRRLTASSDGQPASVSIVVDTEHADVAAAVEALAANTLAA